MEPAATAGAHLSDRERDGREVTLRIAQCIFAAISTDIRKLSKHSNTTAGELIKLGGSGL